MKVLGIDPGLAHLGWAVVHLEPDGERLGALGVVKTVKRSGQGVLVTDDLHRRGMELARALVGILDQHQPVAVCAESISYPRNASASASIGRAWGILDSELERRGLPLISASPQAIKKAATGRLSASKEEVADALDARFGGRLAPLLAAMPKAAREHPADAVGAVVACLDHDHLRLARSVWARGAS